MTITVGFTSGGTYDATARLFSRHYGKHLSGAPQIIVQNMPGSGGVVALNHLYNIAPKDGSTLSLVDGALAFEALFGNPAVKYDPRQFNWIGSRAKETPTCVVWAERSVSTIQEAMQREVVLGATVASALRRGQAPDAGWREAVAYREPAVTVGCRQDLGVMIRLRLLRTHRAGAFAPPR